MDLEIPCDSYEEAVRKVRRLRELDYLAYVMDAADQRNLKLVRSSLRLTGTNWDLELEPSRWVVVMRD